MFLIVNINKTTSYVLFLHHQGKRIRMKRPDTYDIYKLLKTKSANWEDFARELRVKENDRQQFRKLINASSPDDILEKVLAKWIESETCEVTWKNILCVLKDLDYIDLIKIVQMYLRKEDVIRKYCQTADFRFTGESLLKVLFISYSV